MSAYINTIVLAIVFLLSRYIFNRRIKRRKIMIRNIILRLDIILENLSESNSESILEIFKQKGLKINKYGE